MTVNYQFYETTICKSAWDNYMGLDTSMRPLHGLCLVYYVIKYFQPQSILEIGFKEGMTFAAMLEASAPGCHLTGIDIKLTRAHFDKYFNKVQLTHNRRIDLFEIPSQNFVPNCKYNFVNVDGCHEYPQVLVDLATVSRAVDNNAIIMLDDYTTPGVDQAIDDFMKLETGFVPFLKDRQAVYFHHESHDASEFLDKVLDETFFDLASLYNVQYKGHNTKEINFWPAIKDNKIFWLMCNRLKI